MANNDDFDVFANALATARRYNDLSQPEGPSTVDLNAGLGTDRPATLSGVGSRLGSMRSTPEQQDAFHQRFMEARDKPTLGGKLLGAINGINDTELGKSTMTGRALGMFGSDDSGDRARTPWADAVMSTAHMPHRFGDAVYDAGELIYDAVTKPFAQRGDRTEEGSIDTNEMMYPELGRRGIGFAGTLALVAGALARPAQGVGIFAGRTAKTADHAALAKAEAMAADNVPRGRIWGETGQFRAMDGEWLHEIDDSKMRLHNVPTKFEEPKTAHAEHGRPILDLVDHSKFFDAYPDESGLAAQRINGTSRTGWNGMFVKDRGIAYNAAMPDGGRSTVLHELDHVAQNRDKRWTGPGYDRTNPDGYDIYHRSHPEVEARAVQARRDLTPEQRSARPPWEDYDVPESQQIVRFNSNGDKATLPGTVLSQASKDLPMNHPMDTRTPKFVERGYHGTDEYGILNVPMNERVENGIGPWGTSNAKVAETYANIGNSPAIVPVEYRFDNPRVIEGHGRRFGVRTDRHGINSDIEAAMARDAGHDGLVIRNMRDAAGSDLTMADTYAPLKPGTAYNSLTGDLLYSNGDKATIPGTLISQSSRDPIERGLAVARNVDSLGYYSQALEAAKGLKQAKGTPEQMLAMLKKSGVKDAEIEATELRKMLADNPSITRDDIVKHLEGNRVRLSEKEYAAPDMEALNNASRMYHGEQYSELGHDQQRMIRDELGASSSAPKWSAHSLDPSNPTYRETVLHLPENVDKSGIEAALKKFDASMLDKYGQDWRFKMSIQDGELRTDLMK